jgi:hypothetical protein
LGRSQDGLYRWQSKRITKNLNKISKLQKLISDVIFSSNSEIHVFSSNSLITHFKVANNSTAMYKFLRAYTLKGIQTRHHVYQIRRRTRNSTPRRQGKITTYLQR